MTERAKKAADVLRARGWNLTIEGLAACEPCGAELPSGARYCWQCGARVPPDTQVLEELEAAIAAALA